MKFLKVENVRFSLLVTGLFLFLFFCCRSENSQKNSTDSDLEDTQKKNNFILEVEGSFYLNSDFENHIKNTVGNDRETLTFFSLSRLFDSFIEEKILLQAARNQKMSLTWEEKKEYLAKLSNEFRPDGTKVSIDEIDTRILFDGLLIEKYIYELIKGIEVKDEEIKEYYNLNKREFLWPERVEVSQILLKTEDKAIEVLERVKDTSEEDFREIARTESIGVEASKGGKMGLFEMGQLPFEMEKVIFSLKEGELSLVVESSYGYHIFRLDKRYESELISEEQASPSIRVKILDQKIKQRISEHIEDLKKNMEWSFHPQNLSFPYQRNNS